MRRVLELFLISAMVLGSALGAQEENGVLVLDVYSVNVPSDVIHEKSFALWAKALKGGEQSSHEYVPVIHAVYRLGGAVYIDKHYKTGEGNEEQISVVGRVNPEQGGVEYRVEFSELGRPPAYDGKTALTIGPRERRVLVLPAIELDSAKKLQTVVALQYRVEEKDNGLKSKFEINREALIKAYDGLVKTPEDRKRLERSAPLLVAARDTAVVELKREKLAAEIANRNQQKPTIRR